MERKTFESLEMEVVFFEVEDIVRTSVFYGGGMGGDDSGFGGGFGTGN